MYDADQSMTAGARMARDKIFFCDFQNIFLDFTSVFGLQTIFVFVKNLFVDPIILLGFVIVFEISQTFQQGFAKIIAI